ncbi:MAG: hypothetical protein WKF75_02100 [Singulisphaera sp.]
MPGPGRELWKSDGTARTVRVRDIDPGSEWFHLDGGGRTLFFTFEPTTGTGQRSDGTAETVRPRHRPGPGQRGSVRREPDGGGTLFFAADDPKAGRELEERRR